jgi:hypothetical protein
MLLAKKQKNGFVIAMNLYIAKQIAGKSRKFDAYGFFVCLVCSLF